MAITRFQYKPKSKCWWKGLVRQTSVFDQLQVTKNEETTLAFRRQKYTQRQREGMCLAHLLSTTKPIDLPDPETNMIHEVSG